MIELEALAMDNRRARLVVLLLRDPHVLERRERSKDRTANPDRVLPLGRRDDLDLHRGRCKLDRLLLKTSVDARVHRRPTRQDDVPVQVLTDATSHFMIEL